MKSHVEWLPAEIAAARLGFVEADGTVKLHAFYCWLSRERKQGRGITTHRIGRRLRFRAVDLDRGVEAEPEPVPVGKGLQLVSRGKR